MTITPTDIAAVFAWEVLDSRGTPTVACEVALANGARGSAAVPSGASLGTFEATELRDGGERYGGKGVLRAVANVNDILARAVIGRDAANQQELDAALYVADGSADLHNLGANAVLSISLAAMIAAATALETSPYLYVLKPGERPLLPMPMVNIISGGAHAGRALDVQDVLVVPLGATSFSSAIEMAQRVRRATAEVLTDRGLPSALVADEGGLGPTLSSNRAAIDLLVEGIERSGLACGSDVAIAIDIAASQFFDPDTGSYRLSVEDRDLTARELIDELATWCREAPIVSIEDPLADQDWESWPYASQQLKDIQVLGDDLFVTDGHLLESGINRGIANAILVKPNQTGTLSAARSVVEQANRAGYATVLSARSGETEDTWLADLAVGWRTGQIKVGSTMRSERTAKWNRLLRIEAELGNEADFASGSALAPRVASGTTNQAARQS